MLPKQYRGIKRMKRPSLKTLSVITILAASLILTSCAQKKPARSEGKGYESAKEAAEAFANAFAGKDIDKMYEACAIESYMEHYDFEEDIERRKSWSPTILYMSGKSEQAMAFNVASRKSELFRRFYYMYMRALSIKRGDDTFDSGMTVSLEEVGMEAILEGTEGLDGIRKIEVGDVLSVSQFAKRAGIEDFADLYDDERNQKNLSTWEDMYGGDLEDLAVEVTIDRTDYYLFVTVIDYDGKWYVQGTSGMLPSLLGIDVNSGGLCETSEW